jgi:hypothetical protein
MTERMRPHDIDKQWHKRDPKRCVGKDLGATIAQTKEGDMRGERPVHWCIRCMGLLGLIAFLSSVGFMGCATGKTTVMSLDQWQAEDAMFERTAH